MVGNNENSEPLQPLSEQSPPKEQGPARSNRSQLTTSILSIAAALIVLYPVSYGPAFGLMFMVSTSGSTLSKSTIGIFYRIYGPLWTVSLQIPGGVEFLYQYPLLCCRHLYRMPESKLQLLPGYTPPARVALPPPPARGVTPTPSAASGSASTP